MGSVREKLKRLRWDWRATRMGFWLIASCLTLFVSQRTGIWATQSARRAKRLHELLYQEVAEEVLAEMRLPPR